MSETRCCTGKSLSEAFILASPNPQHEDRLFIELQVQYMKIPISNLGPGGTCCVLFLTFGTIFVHNMFSPCSAKRRASDKDLPVLPILLSINVVASHSSYKRITVMTFPTEGWIQTIKRWIRWFLSYKWSISLN